MFRFSSQHFRQNEKLESGEFIDEGDKIHSLKDASVKEEEKQESSQSIKEAVSDNSLPRQVGGDFAGD